MIEKSNSLIMLTWNLIMPIPTGEYCSNQPKTFSNFSFLKIVGIEFKMKLQSLFGLKFFQVPTKLDFLYISPHLSKWNESKLLMFI